MRKYLLPLSAAALAAASSSAFAAQSSDNFQARINIQTACVVTAADLDFGNVGVIDGTEVTTAAVDVNCTAGTAYTLSFSASSAVTSYSSNMAFGANNVAYNASLSAGGGTGPASFTINGSLPLQTTPVPGTYTETRTLYVNY